MMIKQDHLSLGKSSESLRFESIEKDEKEEEEEEKQARKKRG
jgi:hypothetical protein